MVKFLSVVLIGIALAFIVCCREYTDNQLHADEITIYLEIAGSSSPSREIVISSNAIHAIGMTSPEDVRSVFPSTPESVSADFLSKNYENLILKEEDVSIRDGFVLLGSKDLTERLDGIPRYNSFSRVGFDYRRKTAIVWYFDACAPLCGSGGLYLLEYNGEKWVIVAESEKFKS